MQKISDQTLTLCVSAVAAELKEFRASLGDGEGLPEDYEILEDWEAAADELKQVYLERAETVLNLPEYSKLIK